MGKFRGLDKDEGWIKRRFAKIEKQMREDRAAKRAQATTIGEGGITIKGEGYLSALYTAILGGGEALGFGPNPNALGGDAGYVVSLKDESGNYVFGALRVAPNGTFPTGNSTVLGAADLVLLRTPLAEGYFQLTAAGLSIGHNNGVAIDHPTTASAANAVLDSVTHVLARSTSSLRYKQDVEDAEVDPVAVLDMQPRTWRDKAEVEKDPDTETRYVGFIAEELHDLGLGQFVVYDTDGDPEAISYDRLTVALLAVLKDQEKRIAALEADDA